MDAGRRRASARTSVVAGSVWESRMKIDEGKGGIKVFNSEENSEEAGDTGGSSGNIVSRKLKRALTSGVSGKRKTWKSETFEGFDKSPIQTGKGRSDSQKNCEEQCKELSVSLDGGLKKGSLIQGRKLRSESGKELSVSVDGIERSPGQLRKTRSESHKGSEVSGNGDGVERNSIGLRKAKLESNKGLVEASKCVDGVERSTIGLKDTKLELLKDSDESGESVGGEVEGIEKSPIELEKLKPESNEVGEESNKGSDESIDGIEKSPVEIGKTGSDETCKEFVVCQEKVISSSLSNVGQVKSPPEAVVNDDHDDGDLHEEEEEEEGEEDVDEEIEVEIEKKSFDDKEINVPEQKANKKVDIKEISVQEQKPNKKADVKEISVQEQKPSNKKVDVKEISVQEQKPSNKKVDVKEISVQEQKPKKVVNEVRRFQQVHDQKPLSISSVVNKQTPIVKRSIYQNLTRTDPSVIRTAPSVTKTIPSFTKQTPSSKSYESNEIPETRNRLQNLVDLVMWRDVSKSAFVFGIGTFIIVSSSYTKDLNISLISVASYLGLFYLALIFIYRSFICRGAIDIDDTEEDYVVGEEEAIWILKLILPYLNECLLKLRALFSGDPATTMKLAVVLFVLARSGSSITIWKMAKLGFFGVFTLPKVCSSYSPQLTRYGKFWVRRFRDAWDSCSQKKAVAGAIFILFWNLSSIVARIWAGFMLVVAFRYYHQSMMGDDWVEEESGVEDTWQGQIGGQRQRHGPTIVELTKEKKGS